MMSGLYAPVMRRRIHDLHQDSNHRSCKRRGRRPSGSVVLCIAAHRFGGGLRPQAVSRSRSPPHRQLADNFQPFAGRGCEMAAVTRSADDTDVARSRTRRPGRRPMHTRRKACRERFSHSPFAGYQASESDPTITRSLEQRHPWFLTHL